MVKKMKRAAVTKDDALYKINIETALKKLPTKARR